MRSLLTFLFRANVDRSDAFENPVIQKHFRNLEALALDMMAPEDTEDLISKIQTGASASLFVYLIQSFVLFPLSHFLCSSLSQCQRWIRSTSAWALWLKSLPNWCIPPITTPRANQPQNANQVSAARTAAFPLNDSRGPSVGESIFCYCAADNDGGAEKKAKAEVPEEELRAHAQKGTLGKLTVPVLKEACKKFGVRTTGTKKQELIDALIGKLGS